MSARRHISRLFVANRGEIAVRIVRACQSLGIEAVVGVSEADLDTMAARLADRVIVIGPAPATESYLRTEVIVTAALGSGCQALHPGYGFLAESAKLSQMCTDNGLWFVGPDASSISQMGDKVRAREAAVAADVPLVPGTEVLSDAGALPEAAETVGLPMILKAAAGGGGRGMRVVRDSSSLETAFTQATAEAQAAFGDGSVYAERYVQAGRHVEVQVLADSFGNVIHLGERDCSVQRRHQKLVEEAPAPDLGSELRDAICHAAVRLARNTGYLGAGTVEFLVDTDKDEFYFLEMNTRIQVEHPVTELVTGIDLVVEQIRIAQNLRLNLSQDDIELSGHAVECRINAEDPSRGFAPSPGPVRSWAPSKGPNIRFDSHVYEGYVVPPFYDSLLGKLIVHGETRDDALKGMAAALDGFEVDGPATTIPLQKAIITHPDFTAGPVTTRWLEDQSLFELRGK